MHTTMRMGIDLESRLLANSSKLSKLKLEHEFRIKIQIQIKIKIQGFCHMIA